MENLNVNILDYISEDRMQSIAEEEFRTAIRRHLHARSDFDKILTNISYEIALKTVAETTEKSKEDIEQILTRRVKDIILESDKVGYELFRSSDYGYSEGPAVPLLRKIVTESEGLIREVVEKNIKEYNFSGVKAAIMDMVYEIIEEKLCSKEKNSEG